MYGVRYLRAIGYFSMSQCATGLARESRVCPGLAFSAQLPRAHWSEPELCGFFQEGSVLSR